MVYALGIDVGTTYTAAAVSRGGRVEVVGLGSLADNIPSVLYLDGEGQAVVGAAAVRRAVTDPAGVARNFKRRLGDPTPMIVRGTPYSAESLTSKIFRSVYEQVIEREGAAPASLSATFPANWGPYKQELFDHALRLADLEGAATITEPYSAALAYASEQRVPDGAVIGVYDLGGGTFDAAVLRKDGQRDFSLLGESVGVEHLGGVDFDEAIVHHVSEQLGADWPSDLDDPTMLTPMVHLRRACVEAKELLSTELTAQIPVTLPGVSATVSITRPQFEAMIRARLNESVHAMGESIAKSGVETANLTSILLVGGSSRIPLVTELVEDSFGVRVATDVDPLYAVARGAAIHAGGPVDSVSTRPPASAVAAAPLTPSPAAAQPIPAPTPEPAPVPTAVSTPPAVAVETGAAATRGNPLQPDQIISSESAEQPPGRSRLPLLLGAGGLVAILAIAGFFLLNRGGDGNDGAEPGAGDEQGAVVADEPGAKPAGTSVASGVDMVAIAAETYELGIDKTDLSESTPRSFDSDEFYIDAYEVTNNQYASFVGRTVESAAALSWARGQVPSEGDLPVEGVLYEWAEAYCFSLGKRLPTEAEWEIAARGPEALLYPWGDDQFAVELPLEGTYPVGSIAGNVSPFGVFDMVGNVWEWVSDPYDQLRVGEGERLLRGGQNGFIRRNVTRLPVDPTASSAVRLAGFRCAADSVDNDIEALAFGEISPPDVEPLKTPEPPVGFIANDDFTDPTTGWIEVTNENSRFGYHPNQYFHLEVTSPGEEIIADAPLLLSPDQRVALGTEAFPVGRLTSGGSYDFGIIVRQAAADDYLAFVVNPVDKHWRVVRQTPAGPELIGERSVTVPDTAAIQIQMDGDDFRFVIGNNTVIRQTIPGLTGGGTGFLLRSTPGAEFESAHIHFDRFIIKELEG